MVAVCGAIGEGVVRSLRAKAPAARAAIGFGIVGIPVVAVIGGWPFSDVASAAYLFGAIWLLGPRAMRGGICRIAVASLLLGACLLAVFGDHSGVTALAVFGAVTGCVGLCMPAMTGVALGGAGPRQAGLGAATLNAARQAGGALGVALLGSAALQRSGIETPGPDLPDLRLPMMIAAVGYLIAIIVTFAAIGGETRRPRTG